MVDPRVAPTRLAPTGLAPGRTPAAVLWHTLGVATSPMPRSADRADARQAHVLRAVEDFQAGRAPEEAFRRLFEAFHQPLRRFFRRKGLAPEHCLDLAQETLLAVYRGLPTYRPEARFETWLYTLASNAHLKWVRARTASKRSAEEPAPEMAELESSAAPDADPLDQVLDAERRRTLHRAIDALPDQMRRCLVLRLEQERSYGDIAVALGISTETVKSHLRDGRRRLADTLSGSSP